MSDAFNDVLDDADSDNDTTTFASSHSEDAEDSLSNTTTTVTEVASQFADATRSQFTTEDADTGFRNGDVYDDPDGTGGADDTDPRKLFRPPTLNELRYYSREGPYGPAVIKKPINDAFKHGFEVTGDNTEREDGDGTIERFLKDEYLDYYRIAEIKSRRDGLCVLMHQVADPETSVSKPIPRDGSATFEDFQLWTVDNLSDELAPTTVADHTDYTKDQIYVSEGEENGGIAVVDDISHPDHGDVVGYGVKPRKDSTDVQNVVFVHEDRCQAFLWGEHVDGDIGNSITGEHVGESVLTPVLQPLKATQMGYWAMKNILFRYSAPLHAVEPPESWSTDDWNDATEQLENLSMMSDGVLPPGSELTVAEGVSEFDPEPLYSVLVESICAGTVFTKSVLQGTQSGTVSGSETDIKGYFNEVHLLRQQRMEPKFCEVVEKVSKYDQDTIPRVAGVSNFNIEWGPLFKPTDVEQAEGAVSLVTAATNAIKSYVLTPDEARSLVEEEWAEFDIDVSLDELSEEDWDSLDRINMNEAGQGASDNEPDVRQNPQMKNGGGQPPGQNRESSQPTRDSLQALSEERLREELDRRNGD
jgi:hypothetical protein